MINGRDEALLKVESEVTSGMCVVSGIWTPQGHTLQTGGLPLFGDLAARRMELGGASALPHAACRPVFMVSAGSAGEHCRAEQLPATTNSVVSKPGMKFIAYFTVL